MYIEILKYLLSNPPDIPGLNKFIVPQNVVCDIFPKLAPFFYLNRDDYVHNAVKISSCIFILKWAIEGCVKFGGMKSVGRK